eukprot:403349217
MQPTTPINLKKHSIKIIANPKDLIHKVIFFKKNEWREEHATQSKSDSMDLLWMNNPNEYDIFVFLQINLIENRTSFNWFVTRENMVKAQIDDQSLIKDYDYLQEFAPCKINRALMKPMLIHDTLCRISMLVWIKNPENLDIAVYDEPIVNLVFSPIYENKKSQNSGKIPFQKLIEFLQIESKRLNLKKFIMNQIIFQIRIMILAMLQSLPEIPTSNAFGILEFQFTMNENLKIWLFDVKQKGKFMSSRKIQDILYQDLLYRVTDHLNKQLISIKEQAYIIPTLGKMNLHQQATIVAHQTHVTPQSPTLLQNKEHIALFGVGNNLHLNLNVINETASAFPSKISKTPSIRPKLMFTPKILMPQQQQSTSPINSQFLKNFPKVKLGQQTPKIKDHQTIPQIVIGFTKASTLSLMKQEISSPSLNGNKSLFYKDSKLKDKEKANFIKVREKMQLQQLQIQKSSGFNIGLRSPTKMKLLHNKSINLNDSYDSDNQSDDDKQKERESIFTQSSSSESSFDSASSFAQTTTNNNRTISKSQSPGLNWRDQLQQKLKIQNDGSLLQLKKEATKKITKQEELDENLKREVLQYYSDKRGALPAYYYFKQRNKNIMNFVLKSVKQQNYDIKGDINEYYKTLPVVTSTEEQLQIFSEINQLFKRNQLSKDEILTEKLNHKRIQMQGIRSYLGSRQQNELNPGYQTERQVHSSQGQNQAFYNLSTNDNNYCFEMQLANKLRMQKFSIDDFLQKNNFFNKTKEEIDMIYQALKDPDQNQMYLDSLGLTDVEILYKKWLKRQKHIKRLGGIDGLERYIKEVCSEDQRNMKDRQMSFNVRKQLQERDNRISQYQTDFNLDQNFGNFTERQLAAKKMSSQNNLNSSNVINKQSTTHIQSNMFKTEKKSTKALHELLKDLGNGNMTANEPIRSIFRNGSSKTLLDSINNAGDQTKSQYNQTTSNFQRKGTLLNLVRRSTAQQNQGGETSQSRLSSTLSKNQNQPGLRRQGIFLQRKLILSQKQINEASKTFLIPQGVVNKKKVQKGTLVSLFYDSDALDSQVKDKENEKIYEYCKTFYKNKNSQKELILWSMKQNLNIIE